MTRLYEVWIEGYAVTGNSATASLLDIVEAGSFKEAVDKVMSSGEWQKYYDPVQLRYWGCGLYDNETDARKGFG